MIKNFIKSAFRNLWKTKGYSFLNIFGLALGITVTALIFLWVQDEQPYENIEKRITLTYYKTEIYLF